MIPRRSFLTGLASLLAAPAIVHAGNLMPVKALAPSMRALVEYVPGCPAQIEIIYGVPQLAVGDILTVTGLTQQLVVTDLLTCSGVYARAIDLPA